MNKVLLIDEDENFAGVVKSILNTFGYEVDSVMDESELAGVGWNEYRLIIVDWLFAEGALTVFDEARVQGYEGKVMFVSVRAIENNQRLRLDQLGITFLSKPFSAISLSDAVEKAFRN